MTWLDVEMNVVHVLLDVFLSLHSVYTQTHTHIHTHYTPKLLLENFQENENENENVSSFEPKMNLWSKSDLLHVRSNETCYINIRSIHIAHTHIHKHTIMEYTLYYYMKKGERLLFLLPFYRSFLRLSVQTFVYIGFYAEIIRTTPHRKFYEIFILTQN